MQPEVRLRHGREPRREHAEQHTARAGAGWQAHPSELCRCPARRSRSRLRPRAQLAIIRVFGGAAARAPTCGTYPARTPWPIHARTAWLQHPCRARCNQPGLQPQLERTDERLVPQRGSEANREKTSDLTHLGLDHATTDPCAVGPLQRQRCRESAARVALWAVHSWGGVVQSALRECLESELAAHSRDVYSRLYKPAPNFA